MPMRPCTALSAALHFYAWLVGSGWVARWTTLTHSYHLKVPLEVGED
jgi:hypothetical protein